MRKFINNLYQAAGSSMLRSTFFQNNFQNQNKAGKNQIPHQLTGHFHFSTRFSHISQRYASPSKQLTCVQFLPRTGVTIRERVRGHVSEMSITSSFASVWETKLCINCALVSVAGTVLQVLKVSNIPLKLEKKRKILYIGLLKQTTIIPWKFRFDGKQVSGV